MVRLAGILSVMPRRVSLWLVLIFCTAFLASACGDPPTREMDQAQGAIDAARAAGADRYATEEYQAAVDALKQAQEAVAQRDYRLALNHAIDSRERAQNAAKQAAEPAGHPSQRRRTPPGRSDGDAGPGQSTAGRGGSRARSPRRSYGRRATIAERADSPCKKAGTQINEGDYKASQKAAVGDGSPVAGRDGRTGRADGGRGANQSRVAERWSKLQRSITGKLPAA